MYIDNQFYVEAIRKSLEVTLSLGEILLLYKYNETNENNSFGDLSMPVVINSNSEQSPFSI